MNGRMPPARPAPAKPNGSLRLRLTWWFTGSLLVVVLALVVAAYHHLERELKEEQWALPP